MVETVESAVSRTGASVDLSKFKYPCTYVELGTKLSKGHRPDLPATSVALPHFHSQTKMLRAGEVWTFERTSDTTTRIDLVAVTGPCLLKHIRIGMKELVMSGTFAAPRCLAEVGHIFRVTVECSPESFMLQAVAEGPALESFDGCEHD